MPNESFHDVFKQAKAMWENKAKTPAEPVIFKTGEKWTLGDGDNPPENFELSVGFDDFAGHWWGETVDEGGMPSQAEIEDFIKRFTF